MKLSKSKQHFHKISHCPTCLTGSIEYQKELALCIKCKSWYPITKEILELTPINSSYVKERKTFRKRLGIKYKLIKMTKTSSQITPQDIQRKHFDWYATNRKQTYSKYEKMIFWKVTDNLVFDRWKKMIPKQAVILDIGCAQGRSTAPFVNKNSTVIGFDISKKMIEKGVNRFKNLLNPPYLFVGDATAIPLADTSVDVVVLYGVLHHLPHPKKVMKEISRVLKPKGLVLSLENNDTPLRIFFDLLQKIKKLWHEEAGDSPTMSASEITKWFSDVNMMVTTQTHIFIPPHIINLLPYEAGYKIIKWTDAFTSILPWIKSWGGLIEIVGKKSNTPKDPD